MCFVVVLLRVIFIIFFVNSFGAKYAGEDTGIIYNNEMDDFSTPGTVNYFGVPASEPNYIRPGKRPMSSMAPIIIVDENGNVRLALGASGGTKIITAVSQVKFCCFC
jgi:gamma-glutamyltranspeptidase/glutathione hydrolase/leukotriene-C4 hydrolase